MRLLLLTAVGLILLAPASAARAQSFVKYRTAAGEIGFAEDRSRLPEGATVLESGTEPSRQIQIQQAPGVPANTMGSPRPGHADRVRSTIREIDSETGERRRREQSIQQSVDADRKKLADASERRSHACRRSWTGVGRTRRLVDPSACSKVTAEMSAAQSSLDATRKQLEDAFEEPEDYFGPVENDDDFEVNSDRETGSPDEVEPAPESEDGDVDESADDDF